MAICAVVSAALLPLVGGCSSAATQGAESPEKARLTELEQENADLSKRLADAEHARDEALRAARPSPTPTVAPVVRAKLTDAAAAPESLPEVTDLEPKGPGVLKLAPAAPPDEEEPEPRMRPVVRVHGSEEGQVAHVADGAQQRSSGTANADYESALALVQKKKFDQAETALRRFLAQNPDHPFSDNALYWLGECQYARGDYAGAVQSFEAVVTRYPSENKVPDALLKIALSQERLGHDGASKQAIGRLLKDHPDTAAAQRIPERYLSK